MINFILKFGAVMTCLNGAVVRANEAFTAETSEVMSLIINSLYSNKEIFMRELISNSNDALDKIRFDSLTDSDLLGNTTDLEIRVFADEEENALYIQDTGIGMSKEDLVKNLGSIAKSGTKEYMKALNKEDSDTLIGQFGVGFYSAFLVADKVEVTTRTMGKDSKVYTWTSDSSSYSITDGGDEGVHDFNKRGTTVKLYLKKNMQEFLKDEALETLIKKYSEFIQFPIYLRKTDVISEKVLKDEYKDVELEEGSVEDDVPEEEKYDINEKKVVEFEQINTQKPLWQRDASEVTEEEYEEFYKNVFKRKDKPAVTTHFKAEGEINFHAVAFLPLYPSYEKFDQYTYADARLFVRRVFITDNLGIDFLPRYLAFCRAIIETDDFPLNVSREQLQNSKFLKVIRKKLVRKILDEIKKLMKKDTQKYYQFYNTYAEMLKIGISEDKVNQKRILPLIMFENYNGWKKKEEMKKLNPSEVENSDDQYSNMMTIDTYIEEMPAKQKHIYFLSAQNMLDAKDSPYTESMEKRGFNFVILRDQYEEYIPKNLPVYKDLKFVDISAGLQLGDDDEVKQHIDSILPDYNDLLKFMMKTSLSKVIESLKLSYSVTGDSAISVHDIDGLSGATMMSLRARNGYEHVYNNYATRKMKAEINPYHPIILKLKQMVDDNDEEDLDSEMLGDVFISMYRDARAIGGFPEPHSSKLAAHSHRLYRRLLNVDFDAKTESVLDEIYQTIADGSTDEESSEEKIDEEVVDEEVATEEKDEL